MHAKGVLAKINDGWLWKELVMTKIYCNTSRMWWHQFLSCCTYWFQKHYASVFVSTNKSVDKELTPNPVWSMQNTVALWLSLTVQQQSTGSPHQASVDQTETLTQAAPIMLSNSLTVQPQSTGSQNEASVDQTETITHSELRRSLIASQEEEASVDADETIAEVQPRMLLGFRGFTIPPYWVNS